MKKLIFVLLMATGITLRAAVPTVTGVSPAAGPVAGGTTVTITGTGFVLGAGTTVNFGTTAGTPVRVNETTNITVTAPAGTAGTVDVTVTTSGGTSATSSADQFTYDAVPTVTGVSPASGVTAGGSSVTITGTGFVSGATVSFGTVAATGVKVNSATSITATAPAGLAGTVNVTVTTPGGTDSLSSADQFTYYAVPTVTGVSPAAGPLVGGTIVTISGSGFVSGPTVNFGTNAATGVTLRQGRSTTMTATAPAGSVGTVDVTVTTPGGTSATSSSDHFSYDEIPTVVSVIPGSGAAGVETSVTIHGAGFLSGATVSFGTNAATGVTVVRSSEITATGPAGSLGTVDVTVTTPGGTSATGSGDDFTYLDLPVITTAPSNSVVTIGQSASLGVTSLGTGLGYMWFKDGVLQSGQTGSVFTIASMALTNSGSYRVAVTNANGMAIGFPALLTVTNAPLLAWGYNFNGQLGNGGTTQTNTPQSVASNVVVVAAGEYHSLFVTSGGTLWAMGDDGQYELGNGSTTEAKTPVEVVESGAAVVSVAAGYYDSFYAQNDGVLSAVGENTYGELGVGGTMAETSPASVASAVVAVAAGEYHTLFIQTNGTLWAMGDNLQGQLGNGTTNEETVPVRVASSVVAVAAGANHSLFVTTDGTLWAMGDNSDGQLGIGSLDAGTNIPVSVASNVVAVAAGGYHSLFVTSDGTLWAVGLNDYGQLGAGSAELGLDAPVSVASNVVAVAAGEYDSYFVMSDGTLWAMGDNSYGQLGNGSGVSSTNAPAMVPNVVAASLGGMNMAKHALAVGQVAVPVVTGISPEAGSTSGGTTVTIAGTEFGPGATVKFGTAAGTSVTVTGTTNITAKAPAGSAGVVDVTVTTSGGTSATSLADQFVYGAPTVTAVSPSAGPLAGGTTVTITGTRFVSGASVLFGGTAATGVTVNSATSITATAPAGSVGVVNVEVITAAGGSSVVGGDEFAYEVAPTVTVVSPSVGLVAGGTSVAITGTGFTNGATVSFGGTAATGVTVSGTTNITATSPAGTLGMVDVTVSTPGGTSVTSSGDEFNYLTVPVISAAPSNSVATLGQAVSLEITATGGDQGYLWFKDGVLQVGQTGSVFNIASMSLTNCGAYRVAVTNGLGMMISLPALLTVTNVPLLTWGRNNDGQLGNGGTTQENMPESVASNAVMVAAGLYHSLFVKSDGTLWAMGDDSDYELGNDSMTEANTPVSVASNVVAVAGGGYDTLFVESDGSLWSVGDNGYGELGDGGTTTASAPVKVGTNVVAVAAGAYHSLFAKKDGTLWAMGNNAYGQLGAGTVNQSNSPVQVATNVVAVAAGEYHSYYVRSDGTLWAMGYNGYGQLGVGTVNQSNSPVQVATNVVAVAAGSDHGLFVTGDGRLWAMGYNTQGELGNGTTTEENLPVNVASNVVAVAAGNETSYFVKSDGTLWVMGDNTYGELGVGSAETQTNAPAQVPNVTAASLGGMSYSYFAIAVGQIATPVVTGISPDGGATAGGATVTITGTGFGTGATVNFGATAGTSVTVTGTTNITVKSPAESAGVVNVTVTTTGGTSATSFADEFAYGAPAVTAVSPTTGSTAGGTTVTITGTDFVEGTTVKFGSTAATGVTVNSATSITATAPAGTAGTVNVTVTTPGGTSATSSADQFTYDVAPTVTAVSVSAGPTAGGTSVTVTGTGFLSGSSVSFGGTAATGVTVNSATSITATAPAGAAGTVDVTVTTPGGTSATSGADQFTYDAVPAVTAVSPSSGPLAAGTGVTITGTGFVSGATVKFGTTAATGVTVSSATSITASAPAGTAGTVDVTVTTPGGTSTTSSADQFTYDAVPTVTALSPSAGSVAGGTSVTITGTGFMAGATVKFGTTAATGVTVNSATSITASAPAESAATVDVTVTTPGGTSGTSSADKFTYDAVPTVTAVSPSAGALAGGTSVTITGTGFVSGATVRFGTTAATGVTFNSPTSITATSPSGSGTVDVTVTTPGGTSATSSADQFTYAVIPTVTAVSPSAGPLAGGTSVVVTGTGFVAGATVKFGSTAATGVTVNSSTSITATAPAESVGTVDVTVTTPGGTGATSSADQFTFDAVPTVTAVSPSAGPVAAGTSVTITGTGFVSGATVKFGTASATGVTFNGVTSITVTAPAGTVGTVDVTVTTPGGTSATSSADQFTFDAVPTVTALSPSAGSVAGGTSVTITGTGFVSGARVKFGTTSATGVTVSSATSITATTPAESAATVDVRVTTPGGTSTTSSADQFTYEVVPTVTGVSPSAGPLAGGTSVTIAGTGFVSGATVKFGLTAAAGVTVNSATSITAISSAGSAGTVDVTVTTPGGTSATSSADQFTFDAVPTVTAVSPSAGPVAGGTSVTITGSGFVSGATVNFGATAATGVTVNSATSITATAPAVTAGTVDVTVTTPGGVSATSGVDQFTYDAIPTVTAVSSNFGPASGGTSVTIAGTGFVSGATVKFGTMAATGVTVTSSTSITATSPSGAAGVVDVTVTTPGGTSATGSADKFTYDAVPTVAVVSPNFGPVAGGTSVTITGTGFVSGATVKFGNAAATGVTFNSATSITATSPAESAGTVDVTVTTPGGTSATSSADQFAYEAVALEVSSSPTNAYYGAGQTVPVVVTFNEPVAVTGTPQLALSDGGTAAYASGTGTTNLLFNYVVAAGDTNGPLDYAATNALTLNSGSIVDTVAGNPAILTLAVPGTLGSLGSNTVIVIDTISPVVTITGPSVAAALDGGSVSYMVTYFDLNFSNAALTAANVILTNPAVTATVTVVTNNATNYTVTLSALVGGGAQTIQIAAGTAVDLAGNTDAGAGPSGSFAVAPTVAGVSPATGPGVGGTSVTITGNGFVPGATVAFGATPATGVTVNSPTSITATAPAGTPGTVDVTVTTQGGTSATSGADQFTYDAVPSVSALSPLAGPLAGGSTVIISGTGFVPGATVAFGATPATGVTVNSATSITATSPAGTAGTVDVTVTTAGGTSATSSADQFIYDVVPTVTAVSPTAGPLAGGTSVTITGTGFVSGATVAFGATAATGVTVNSTTSITATAPAGAAGTVDLIVTTAGGASATSAADQFTYDAIPTVTAVSPNFGPAAGGTSVTITGTGFLSGATVNFGATAAGGVTFNSATSITATSPAESVGTVDVTVTTPGGTSAASAADQFAYEAVVIEVSSTPTNAYYGAGQTVPVVVTFDQPVTVTGTPLLALGDGGTAFYASGTGTTNIEFDYVVSAGDTNGPLDYAATNALSLNSGSIVDALAGNPAILTLAAPGTNGSLGSNTVIVIDTIAPVATISAPSVSSALDGDSVSYTVTYFDLNFSNAALTADNVILTNTTLTGSVTVTSNNATNYTVTISSLDGTGSQAIQIAAGTAVDLVGNTDGGTGPSGGFSLAAPTPPGVVAVASSPASAYYRAGQVVPVTVSFTGAVSVTGTPQLALNDGGTAVYVGGSGTTNLLFNYTVGVGDTTSQLEYLSTSALSLNGGTIASNGVAAALALPTPGQSGSLSASTLIVIDTTVPLVTISAPSTATANDGGSVSFTVTYLDANLGSVTLTPANVTLTNPAVTGMVAVTPNNPTNYTVTILSLGGVGAQAIRIGAGTAVDLAGNTAGAAGPSGGWQTLLPATHFEVSLPSGAVSGQPFSGTVTALNSANMTALAYSGTVRFASTDPSAVLPGNATLVNGSGNFSFTLRTEGAQTVTATDTVTSSITGRSGVVMVETQPLGVGLYVGNAGANSISRVTTNGVVSTLATGFNAPEGLAFDPAGNLYVANYGGTTVLKVTTNGVVTPYASGFNGPQGLAFDSAGNLYVANYKGSTVSKVTPGGVVSTFAGGFNGPGGLVFDSAGNLYVANAYAGTVSEVTTGGVVSTYANGFNGPSGVAFDKEGNLYVSNAGNGKVSKVATNGVVTTFATGFSAPGHLLFDGSGNLYVANIAGNTVSVVTPGGVVSTFATGFSTPVALAIQNPAVGLQVLLPGETNAPNTLAGKTGSPVAQTAGTPFTVTVNAVDGNYNIVSFSTPVVALTGSDSSATLPANAALFNGTGSFAVTLATAGEQTVTAVDTTVVNPLAQGTSSSVEVAAGATSRLVVSLPATAGSGIAVTGTVTAEDAVGNPTTGYAGTVSFSSTDGSAVLPGNLTLSGGSATFSVTMGTPGSQTVTATDTVTPGITGTSGVVMVGGAAEPAGLYVANAGTGAVSLVATNGTVSTLATGFNGPEGLAFDRFGNLYAANYGGNTVSKVGTNGVSLIFASGFNGPQGLAFDRAGNLYVANYKGNTVSKVTTNGVVTTFATGFNGPAGLVFDNAGNLYVANIYGGNISKVTPGGVVTTYFGTLATPEGLAFDTAGNLYISSVADNQVWKVTTNGVAAVFASGISAPGQLVFDGSGNLYVTSISGGTVSEVTPGGFVTTYASGFSTPVGLAIQNPAVGLQVLLPGETNAPNTVAGKTGSPTMELAGVPFNVTVNAVDGNGVMIPGATPTVAISSSDVAAGLPANATLANGSLTFTVTLNSGGLQTVTASDTAASNPLISGSSSSVEVGTGVASQFAVVLPGAAAAGSSVSGTVTALDVFGNVVGGYAGTVRFSSTDPAAGLPGSATLVNGVGTFGFTFQTAGSQTVTATDTVSSTVTGTSGSVTVSANVLGVGLYVANAAAGTVSMVATNGTVTPLVSGFNGPEGLAFDAAGNLYVANYGGTTVSKVTTAGTVTTYASGFNGPQGLVFDSAGNLYVANYKGNTISKVTTNGVVSTFATGFNGPAGLVFDSAGNLYVANVYGANVSKVTPGGVVTTYFATLATPEGLAFDTSGNLYISSVINSGVWKVTTNGVVTAFASGISAPGHLAFDGAGNLYVTSISGGTVSEATTNGVVSTFATGFNTPVGLAMQNPAVGLQILLPGETNAPYTVTGKTGAPTGVTAGVPFTVTVNAVDGNWVVVPRVTPTVAISSSDFGATLPANAALVNGTQTFAVTLETAGAETLIATDTAASNPLAPNTSSAVTVGVGAAVTFVVSLPTTATSGVALTGTVTAFDANGNFAAAYAGTVRFGSTDGAAVLPGNLTLSGGTGAFTVTLETPGAQTLTVTDTVTPSVTGTSGAVTVGGAAEPVGLYVANAASGTISLVTTNGTVSTLAGGFNGPEGVAFDRFGNLYVANYGGNTVSRVGINGVAVPFAGGFNGPQGLIFDRAGNLYVSNYKGNTVAKVTTNGVASIFATGFHGPNALAFDGAGSLYVANAYSGSVSKVTPGGVVSTYASGFGGPTGLAFDVNGNLYVSDLGENVVWQVTTNGVIATFATGLNEPTGLVFDGSGNLYAANLGNGTVSQITPGGTVTSYASGFSTPVGLGIVNPAVGLQVLLPGETSAPHTATGKIGSPASQLAGTPFSVTVNAVDGNGAVVPGALPVVTLSSSDGAALLPADAALLSGTGSFIVTLNTVGQQTVTATDTTAVNPLAPGVSASVMVNSGGFSSAYRGPVRRSGVVSSTTVAAGAVAVPNGTPETPLQIAIRAPGASAPGTGSPVVLTISGAVGTRLQVLASSDLSNPAGWTVLTNLTLTASPVSFADPSGTLPSVRYYRVVQQP